MNIIYSLYAALQFQLRIEVSAEFSTPTGARSVQHRLDSGRLVGIDGMMKNLPNSINLHRAKGLGVHPIADRFIDLLRNNIAPVG